MYPQQNQTRLQQLMTKKWFVIGVPVAVVVLILVGLLIFLPGSLLQRTFPKYDFAKANLNYQNNYGHLRGSELFAFNGLSFYKTNLETGKETVLSTGQRLPKPKSIHWAGENGALVTFASSYYMSAVETALQAEGKEIDTQTQAYTWYLDFQTGKLTIASTEPLLADRVYYSESENGFYFVPDQTFYHEGAAPLAFFDISEGKTKTIVPDLDIADLGAISQCSDEMRVCVIMRDSDDPASEKLYGLDGNSEKKLLLDSGGQIFPTNDPHRFITVERGSIATTHVDETLGTAESVDRVDAGEAPAKLRDIKTSKTYDLGFEVGLGEPNLHFVDDKKFYVLDGTMNEFETDGNQEMLYRSGELSGDKAISDTYTLMLPDGSKFDGQIVSETSHGSGSNMLVSTVDGDQFLVSNEEDLQGLNTTSSQAALSAIGQCANPSMTDDPQYLEDSQLIRIFFRTDDNFAAGIKQFGDCMKESSISPLHGLNFQLAGTDPVNGRISTD